MIYQEMYGYLTIEDPREQDKVWQSLSPQVRDYLNVFLDLMNQAQENVYYEKSKFYRLITEEEFENLRLVYLKMQSKEIVIDAAFEEEFKQAFITFEKKAAMKAKMNQWRSEMENNLMPAPTSVQENVFYSKQRKMVDSDEMLNTAQQSPPKRSIIQNEGAAFGCIIALVVGVLLVAIGLYFFLK